MLRQGLTAAQAFCGKRPIRGRLNRIVIAVAVSHQDKLAHSYRFDSSGAPQRRGVNASIDQWRAEGILIAADHDMTAKSRLVEIVAQFATAAGMPQTPQGASFDLPDAFACQAEFLPDFFQRVAVPVLQAEAQA